MGVGTENEHRPMLGETWLPRILTALAAKDDRIVIDGALKNGRIVSDRPSMER